MSVPIQYDTSRPGIARIILDRADTRNAQDTAFLYALNDAFDRAAHDDEIKVIVLSANGPHFSSGHDLREVAAGYDYATNHDLLTRCSAMMMSIRRLPQPVIAKVHALATAAGCQLVAACDLAVAANTASFATSGINNGLFCGTPSVPVGRNVGAKRALDMLFTGQAIDAETALRDGLVSRLAPPEKLDAETMALARHIADQPPQQIAEGKAMFHRHMEMGLEQAYAYATDFMAGALQREDPQAGIDAFVNKKPKPEWTGK